MPVINFYNYTFPVKKKDIEKFNEKIWLCHPNFFAKNLDAIQSVEDSFYKICFKDYKEFKTEWKMIVFNDRMWK